LFANSIKRQHI